VLGKEVHIHHAAVGQKRNVADALDIIRDERPPAGVDENSFRLQKLLADANAVRCLEPRMSVVVVAVFEPFHPLANALARSERNLLHPLVDPLHIDSDRTGYPDTVLGGAVGQMSDPRAGDQGLGRNAAGIDASAAGILALDHGRLEPLIG